MIYIYVILHIYIYMTMYVYVCIYDGIYTYMYVYDGTCGVNDTEFLLSKRLPSQSASRPASLPATSWQPATSRQPAIVHLPSLMIQDFRDYLYCFFTSCSFGIWIALSRRLPCQPPSQIKHLQIHAICAGKPKSVFRSGALNRSNGPGPNVSAKITLSGTARHNRSAK
jgi:hypothetical protein